MEDKNASVKSNCVETNCEGYEDEMKDVRDNTASCFTTRRQNMHPPGYARQQWDLYYCLTDGKEDKQKQKQAKTKNKLCRNRNLYMQALMPTTAYVK